VTSTNSVAGVSIWPSCATQTARVRSSPATDRPASRSRSAGVYSIAAVVEQCNGERRSACHNEQGEGQRSYGDVRSAAFGNARALSAWRIASRAGFLGVTVVDAAGVPVGGGSGQQLRPDHRPMLATWKSSAARVSSSISSTVKGGGCRSDEPRDGIGGSPEEDLHSATSQTDGQALLDVRLVARTPTSVLAVWPHRTLGRCRRSCGRDPHLRTYWWVECRAERSG
jgi:hypothetical protein